MEVHFSAQREPLLPLSNCQTDAIPQKCVTLSRKVDKCTSLPLTAAAMESHLSHICKGHTERVIHVTKDIKA